MRSSSEHWHDILWHHRASCSFYALIASALCKVTFFLVCVDSLLAQGSSNLLSFPHGLFFSILVASPPFMYFPFLGMNLVLKLSPPYSSFITPFNAWFYAQMAWGVAPVFFSSVGFSFAGDFPSSWALFFLTCLCLLLALSLHSLNGWLYIFSGSPPSTFFGVLSFCFPWLWIFSGSSPPVDILHWEEFEEFFLHPVHLNRGFVNINAKQNLFQGLLKCLYIIKTIF